MFDFGKLNHSGNVSVWTGVRAMAGLAPSPAGLVMRLQSVALRKQPGPAIVGVYVHNSDVQPSGAQLLEEISINTPSGGQAFSHEFAASASNPVIPPGSFLWLAVENDGSWQIDVTSEPGEAGDWTQPRYQSSALASPFPAVWPADAGAFGGNFWSAFVRISTESGGGDPTPPTNSQLLPGSGSKKLYSGIGFGAFSFR